MNRRSFLAKAALLPSALLLQRAEAHNALIATYILQQDESMDWTLTVSASLAGLHQAMLQHYRKDELVIEGQYNQPLAVDYLLSHCQISTADNRALTLESTQVRIGNHQSDFVFKLLDAPKPMTSLNFTVDAMAENPGHMNLMRVKSGRFNKKVILQYANDYKGSISIPTFL